MTYCIQSASLRYGMPKPQFRHNELGQLIGWTQATKKLACKQFCAVTTGSKLRWTHRRKAYFCSAKPYAPPDQASSSLMQHTLAPFLSQTGQPAISKIMQQKCQAKSMSVWVQFWYLAVTKISVYLTHLVSFSACLDTLECSAMAIDCLSAFGTIRCNVG